MTMISYFFRSLLVALLLVDSSVRTSSFALQQQQQQQQQRQEPPTSQTKCYYSIKNDNNIKQQMDRTMKKNHRRSFLGVFAASLGSLFPAQDAMALKKKDEILCGTGFFTNIAQYKCTEIGDIWDEGKPKDFSQEELGSMESLMGKFENNLNENNGGDETSSSGGQQLGNHKSKEATR